MLLAACGVCGCLALPLAIYRIVNISSDMKREKEMKERGNPSLVNGQLPNRVEAAYQFDEEDMLSFVPGEIIAVTGMSVIGIYGVFIICVIGQEDEDWWLGHIESQPHRCGVFPAEYVKSIGNCNKNLKRSLSAISPWSTRIPFLSEFLSTNFSVNKI